jgi:hypothetical protein
MAYLGRGLDKISNIEVLDNITFDGSSSYSITKGSVAFTPNSAQSCLISIDGVVQATNFTVSSSTIDFGVAIPSTSVCNFFLHYGTGVMTVPSDGSVTPAKMDLSQNYTFTGKVSGHNYPSFLARNNANQSISPNTNTKVTFGTEEYDTDSAFASSKFTVPTGKDGKYFIYTKVQQDCTTNAHLRLKIYKNGSEIGQTFTALTDNVEFTSWNGVIDLSASDYIEIYILQNSDGGGASRDVLTNGSLLYTFFGGYRIGN